MSVAMIDPDEEARLFAYTDPAIKLFGRDIPLTASTSHEASGDASIVPDEQLSDQDVKPEKAELEECYKPMDAVSDEVGTSGCISNGSDAMGGTVAVKKLVADDIQIVPGDALQSFDIDSQGHAAAALHEKMPKKPDKLIPCPRCHSIDTKFCYFNNYNVNQPRHFCRKCQRYWTAGGTLRNVPVGAGRRKHKHSLSHQKHLHGLDTMPVRTNSADIAHQRSSLSFSSGFSSGGSAISTPSKPLLRVLPLETHAALGMESPSSNSTMLNFGQESPLCKSMAATTLSMQECGAVQTNEILNCNVSASGDAKSIAANGKRLSEMVQGFACNAASSLTSGCYDAAATNVWKKVVPSSSGPTADLPVEAAAPSSEGEPKLQGMQLGEAGYANCGAGWQQPSGNMMSNATFNPATAYTVEGKTALNDAQLRLPPANMLPSCNGAPGSFWAGFPWPLMNPAMWGPPPSEWVGPWTLPFCPPAVAAAAAAAAAAATLLPYSPSASTLEKKPQQSEGSQPEKCLWVPKTLRIDDPLEAARSSIWATLGLGDGPLSHPVNGSAKAFRVKSEFKDYNETITNAQQHMNPAASSRSAAFHESS